MTATDPDDTASRRIELDTTTDDTLGASLDALACDDRDRLFRAVRDRMLIDRIRASVAQHYPNRSPIGALFETVGADDKGPYLADCTVLFEGGVVDYLYDDDLIDAMREHWPTISPGFRVSVDLRPDIPNASRITDATTVESIYTWFNIAPPA